MSLEPSEEKGYHGKLMIATPFYSMAGWSPYISSLAMSIRVLERAGVEWTFVNHSGDSYIDRARNSIADMFVDSEFTDLLFIDSDMAWDEIGFARILCAKADIVGAAYPCKNRWDDWGVRLLTNYDATHTPIINKAGLLKAHSVPTGMCKINKRVFQLLSVVQHDNHYYEQGHRIYNFFGRIPPLGEDTSFCKRCRDASIDMWVEPRVNVGHSGWKMHEGSFHKYLTEFKGDFNAAPEWLTNRTVKTMDTALSEEVKS